MYVSVVNNDYITVYIITLPSDGCEVLQSVCSAYMSDTMYVCLVFTYFNKKAVLSQR